MRQISLLLFVCILTQTPSLAQHGVTVMKSPGNSDLISIYFSSYEYNNWPPSYLSNSKIRQVTVIRNTSGQKKRSEPQSKVVTEYDSTGNEIMRQIWYKGKPSRTHRTQTSTTGHGVMSISEWRGNNNKFMRAALVTWDSVARKSSYSYQYQENGPFLLSNETEYTPFKRLSKQLSYNKKGQLTAFWIYTYHESSQEELKRIEKYNGKGKSVSEQEFGCTSPGPVASLAKNFIQDCKRTDKDPMGNRIEIEEIQQGKKRIILTSKFNQNNRLVEVEMKDEKNNIIKTGRNEYNAAGQLILAQLFVKGKKQAAFEKRYFYDGKLLQRVVFSEKGKEKAVTEYRFDYF
ncbi:MAG TPA: hypothetical protein VK202_11800 [Bacteroidia bacterium]|nr:hypothetical protein [Bacteroidia bacterium]